MKKYLLGFFAVVLAIGFSAFTVKDDSLTQITFVFQGQTTDVDQVQDETLWELTTSGSCTFESHEKACTVKIPDNVVDEGQANLADANASITIEALQFGAADYYVSAVKLSGSAIVGAERVNIDQ